MLIFQVCIYIASYISQSNASKESVPLSNLISNNSIVNPFNPLDPSISNTNLSDNAVPSQQESIPLPFFTIANVEYLLNFYKIYQTIVSGSENINSCSEMPSHINPSQPSINDYKIDDSMEKPIDNSKSQLSLQPIKKKGKKANKTKKKTRSNLGKPSSHSLSLQPSPSPPSSLSKESSSIKNPKKKKNIQTIEMIRIFKFDLNMENVDNSDFCINKYCRNPGRGNYFCDVCYRYYVRKKKLKGKKEEREHLPSPSISPDQELHLKDEFRVQMIEQFKDDLNTNTLQNDQNICLNKYCNAQLSRTKAKGKKEINRRFCQACVCHYSLTNMLRGKANFLLQKSKSKSRNSTSTRTNCKDEMFHNFEVNDISIENDYPYCRNRYCNVLLYKSDKRGFCGYCITYYKRLKALRGKARGLKGAYLTGLPMTNNKCKDEMLEKFREGDLNLCRDYPYCRNKYCGNGLDGARKEHFCSDCCREYNTSHELRGKEDYLKNSNVNNKQSEETNLFISEFLNLSYFQSLNNNS